MKQRSASAGGKSFANAHYSVPFRPFRHMDVEVWSERRTIPTYLPGPEDLNPPIFQRGYPIYPYRWKKSFSTRVEAREYDTVVLRSDWMELVLLPDWGFHLYRAVDRTTGADMFHCPPVMKTAYNALIGAYVAGGVEFNFPYGHNFMGTDRVPLTIRKTDEGVAALFHHIDRRSCLAMTGGVTLVGDARAAILDVYLYNPTPLPQGLYFWLNAGLRPKQSLRFLFPTDRMLGHFEGPFLETVQDYPYPIRGGIDYSRNSEVPEPIGLFSPGGTSGWFGAWYEDEDYGLARWVPPWKVAGQKYWSWGNSPEGLLWGQIAGDSDLPFPEIQSGRPETQMDRGTLPPHARLRHREWWMPVAGIGGISAASRFGAMNVAGKASRRQVKVCPAVTVRSCRLEIDGRTVGGRFDLVVGKQWESSPCESKIIRNVRIVSGEGTLLEWSAEPEPHAITTQNLTDRPRPLAELSAEALYLRGSRYERIGRADLARRFYGLALAKDRDYSKAHRQLGLLALQAGDARTAMAALKLALESDRWDEEALYLYGLASLWLGDLPQARADLSRVAATGRQYVSPAIVLLAMDALATREHGRAAVLIADGLEADPGNATLTFLHALTARRAGDAKAAGRSCERLDELLGVSLMACFERHWMGMADKCIRIRAADETEDLSLIAAADLYAECGQTAEARQILEQAKSPAGISQAHYLLRTLGATKTRPPASTFFAWGHRTRQALVQALKARPADPIAHFGLGCILAEIGQAAGAAEHFRKAAMLRPNDSVIAVALGSAYLAAGRAAAAVKTLERAISLSPPNPSAWVRMDQALGILGRRNSRWLARFDAAPAEVLDNEEARACLACLRADLGMYDRAAQLLTGRTFHPYEMTHHLRNLWSRIHRCKAVELAAAGDFAAALTAIDTALEYPPNLNLARPLRTYDARTLYAAALIAEKAGEAHRAKRYLELASAEFQPDPTAVKPFSALATIRLGRAKEGLARLDDIIRDAARYKDASFNPDHDEALQETIDLARRIKRGWRSGLKDLHL